MCKKNKFSFGPQYRISEFSRFTCTAIQGSYGFSLVFSYLNVIVGSYSVDVDFLFARGVEGLVLQAEALNPGPVQLVQQTHHTRLHEIKSIHFISLNEEFAKYFSFDSRLFPTTIVTMDPRQFVFSRVVSDIRLNGQPAFSDIRSDIRISFAGYPDGRITGYPTIKTV